MGATARPEGENMPATSGQCDSLVVCFASISNGFCFTTSLLEAQTDEHGAKKRPKRTQNEAKRPAKLSRSQERAKSIPNVVFFFDYGTFLDACLGVKFSVFPRWPFFIKKHCFLRTALGPSREHHFPRSGAELEGLGTDQNEQQVSQR